jgi:hypothetical protein
LQCRASCGSAYRGARTCAIERASAKKGTCGMTKQLLHLVIGGELTDPTATEFVDLAKVDIVGL